MRFLPTGLRSKIVLTFFIAFALLLSIISVFFYYQLNSVLFHEQKDFLRETALLVREQVKNSPKEDLLKKTDDLVDRIAVNTRFRISIVDQKGVLIADSAKSGPALIEAENHGERPEILQIKNRGEGWGKRMSITTGQEHLYFAFPLDDERLPGASIRVASYLAGYKELISSILITGLFLLVGLILISLVTGTYLSRWVLQPIQEMSRIARQFANQTFHEKLHMDSKDELGALANTLNDMAGNLQFHLQELTREKGQLETILANMSEGVLVTTKTRDILHMNPAFKKFFQTETPEKTKNVLEHLRNIKLEDCLKDALVKGEVVQRELKLEMIPSLILEVGASPMIVNETVVGIVAVFHDVTDMRHIEQERIDFFQNISHELKTPLTSIKGYVESVLEDTKLDQGLKDQIQVIQKNSNRLEELLQDILDLSKAESGKIKPDYRPIDATASIREIIQNFDTKLKEKQIRVITEFSNEPLMIEVGENHLNQIFSNLISNAITYSEPNTTIEVRGSIGSSKATMVEFVVQDHGMGMTQDDAARVFERFYRVDQDRNRATGGSGLGLSIAKSLVDTYGGNIRVESQVGIGSSFTVFLPLSL